MIAIRLADAMYRVEHEGRNHIVYVAGPRSDRWAFYDGQVFRANLEAEADEAAARRGTGAHVLQSLTAPMPATILRVLVEPGARVRKGDTIVVVEAMKMELPIRAPGEAVVRAVTCRVGDLVQPDQILVELE
jgi:3-methylcrotonyl-CoA carboxylase alpha subunit